MILPPPSKPGHLYWPDRIEALWGPREDKVESIASRFGACLRALRCIHPVMAQWRPFPKKLKNWRKKLPPLDLDDPRDLVAFLEGSDPMGETYMFDCTNGTVDGHNLSVKGTAGSSDPTRQGTGLENRFWVEWSDAIFDPKANTDLLRDRAVTEKIMEAIVHAWDPDFCHVAGSYGPPLDRYEGVQFRYLTPHVGWLLYLKGRRLSPKDVPSAYQVRPMGKDGTLIVVSDQMIGTSDPDHWALSNRVREELGLPFPYIVGEIPGARLPLPPHIIEKLRKPDPEAAEMLREIEEEEKKHRDKSRKKAD